jgi:mono/diheme cytochrome c family protein
MVAWLVVLSAATTRAAGAASPVFSKDIAPIVFTHCAGCHHVGQAAPFPLLSYDQVRKHAKQIVEVTGRRYMPPWLPAPGYNEFAGDRSLSEDQIALIRRWVDGGMARGNEADEPPAPKFEEGWTLGKPDLVLTIPQVFHLPAGGKDVYRNLVTPIPTAEHRYVKAVEFLPGNPRVMHHAFIDVDETRRSRRLAARENPPGFDGMELPETVMMPSGQLMGWQPGKVPTFAAPGLSWGLKTNTDLVLQMHMHPSGKPEEVQPTLGFYWTDIPPTNAPFRIGLKYFKLNIPPGATNYAVDASYMLPVDVKILRVSTHSHYLAKEMQGFVTLPGGEKKWLIYIKDWDFNWQGDYQYKQPLLLPKGSEIHLHYTFDNSTNNVRNPSATPGWVRFGPQTTDEMAELWLQAITRNTEERQILARDYFNELGKVTMDFDQFRLSLDPDNAEALTRLGHDLHVLGRTEEATSLLSRAVRVKPDFAKGHYELGLLFLSSRLMESAEQEFLTAARLDPYNAEARGNLGGIYLQSRRIVEARAAFESALKINPDDAVARKYLDLLTRR